MKKFLKNYLFNKLWWSQHWTTVAILTCCISILGVVVAVYSNKSTARQGLTVHNTKASAPDNLELSGDLATVDGALLSSGDIVLLQNQTDVEENGLYRYQNGKLTIYTELDNENVVLVFISQGATYAGRFYSLQRAASARKTQRGGLNIVEITTGFGPKFSGQLQTTGGVPIVPVLNQQNEWESREFKLSQLYDVELGKLDTRSMLTYTDGKWSNSVTPDSINPDFEILSRSTDIVQETSTPRVFKLELSSDSTMRLPVLVQRNDGVAYQFLKTSALGVALILPAAQDVLVGGLTSIQLVKIGDSVNLRGSADLHQWSFL